MHIEMVYCEAQRDARDYCSHHRRRRHVYNIERAIIIIKSFEF